MIIMSDKPDFTCHYWQPTHNIAGDTRMVFADNNFFDWEDGKKNNANWD